MSPGPEFFRVKVVSIGDPGVGKSCLIKRYCEQRFVPKYSPTVGVDFGVKTVEVEDAKHGGRVDVRVNFFDLSGHQEFFEVRNEFYKDMQGVLVVYDMSRRATFENVDKWISEATKFSGKTSLSDAVVLLIANKTDLKHTEVTAAEGDAYAKKNGYMYFEVSAKSGMHIESMFHVLFEKMFANVQSASV